ncbi:MAG: hypothetical protein M3512_18180 [Bacteroidota bacterium]|nr:hypothetical protein [Bacteroidota bacterium]
MYQNLCDEPACKMGIKSAVQLHTHELNSDLERKGHEFVVSLPKAGNRHGKSETIYTSFLKKSHNRFQFGGKWVSVSTTKLSVFKRK